MSGIVEHSAFAHERRTRIAILHLMAISWGVFMSAATICSGVFLRHDTFYKSPAMILLTIIFWFASGYVAEFLRFRRWEKRHLRDAEK